MASSFRFLYRTARNVCLVCQRHRRLTCAETSEVQKSVGDGGQKPLYSMCPVDVDYDEMRSYNDGRSETCDEVTPVSGGPELEITDDADEDNEMDTAAGGVVPIDSCVAAVGVAMASVATSSDARRQPVIMQLTRLRQQIGVGLHSADGVQVPVWLSLLLVVVYIAVGAVMFSAWESVRVTSESFLCCITPPLKL